MEEKTVNVALAQHDVEKLNYFLSCTYYDISGGVIQEMREENRKQKEELNHLKEEVNLLRRKIIQLDSRDTSEVMRLVRDISAEYIENNITV